jgi:HEPN domain-containing protein
VIDTEAQEKFGHWLEYAQYDLDTADAMFVSGRWIYVVFMCQQAVEKLVKGLYVLYVDDNVPKTHNIRVLVERFESQLPEPVTEERYNLFEDLTIHYLNGRYTDYKQKLSERLNKSAATDFLKRSKEVFAWLLTLKPSTEQ